jgi:hypothetical protein
MPTNRIAPNNYNALYNSVPDPTARTPEYAPPLGIRQQLENVSAGLGRGAVTQLQDVQALVSDPRAYATNTLRGMRELMRNPALIGNVLRDTARRAKSGPLGFGEVAGEMLPLRPGGRAPDMLNVDKKFPPISPERANAMKLDLWKMARENKITYDELFARLKPLEDITYNAERAKTMLNTARPVFENMSVIPVGTKIKFQHGFNEDIREGVVVGTHVLQSKTAGTARAPIVRLPNGREIRLAPHNIKEVYAPRSINTPDTD